MTDHAELRRLAKAATPGPWEYQATLKILAADMTSIVLIALSHANYREDEANSRLIAAANPKTILALLDEIDRLKAENEVLRGALKPFAEFERVRSAMGGNAPREGILYGVHSNTGSAELHVEHMQAAQSALEGATQ
ncbi:ead/Ea22-like family protein [Pseudomonas aeruginosa]|uniref:ead/Ea22-like family protein n=1 Tax=Pseudomonas aeruginosa TaxID=287 RepID=UPI001CD5F910|nr:ead/Ea22-like family protein [Pseudomonas aeruginosa]